MEVRKVPAAVDAAGGIWRAILPERTVEDVLSGRVVLRFGDSTFILPVLVIAQADEWRELVVAAFGDIMTDLEGQATVANVLSFMGGQTDRMLALIRAYDKADTLPDDDWFRSHASEPEVLRAFTSLLAASYPFIAAALDILAANPSALVRVLEEFSPSAAPIPSGEPTSTPPAPTGGAPNRSERRSRTSSSRAT